MTPIETNYDKAFQLFVGKDDLRLDMMHPFKRNGWYYATDAHSAMMLPASEVQLDYPEQLNPNVEAVVPKDETMAIVFKVADLKAKMVLEMIDEEVETGKYVECVECKGSGTVEVDYDGIEKKYYGLECDCPRCDGSGASENPIVRKTGKQVPNPQTKYILFGVGFTYSQLGRMIAACELIQADTLIKTFGIISNGNVFKAGAAKFLVMPFLMADDDGSKRDYHTIDL